MSVPYARVARLREAAARAREAMAADYLATVRYDAKYGAPAGGGGSSFAAAAVKRVGLQLSCAVRVMQFFEEAGLPLAAQVTSRLIRFAYGSDVHWKAQVAPGVVLVHGMGIAISSGARVGTGALLFHNVTLGAGTHPETREKGSPTLEDGVHIGPGAVIIGPVTIGAGSKIMANCVVTRSVPPDSLVEAPAPTIRPRARERSFRAEAAGARRQS